VSIELQDWKDTIDAAIQEYTINRCEKTAQGLAHALSLWCPHGWGEHPGITAAIARELRIWADAQTLFSSRFLFLTHWLFRAFTWDRPTWDDYFVLRWVFRQEEYCVAELHRRLHMKNKEGQGSARASVLKLLGDPQFRNTFRYVAAESKCEECLTILQHSDPPCPMLKDCFD
jgi:hypothetical protein